MSDAWNARKRPVFGLIQHIEESFCFLGIFDRGEENFLYFRPVFADLPWRRICVISVGVLGRFFLHEHGEEA
jgi:hypothetical protein